MPQNRPVEILAPSLPFHCHLQVHRVHLQYPFVKDAEGSLLGRDLGKVVKPHGTRFEQRRVILLPSISHQTLRRVESYPCLFWASVQLFFPMDLRTSHLHDEACGDSWMHAFVPEPDRCSMKVLGYAT